MRADPLEGLTPREQAHARRIGKVLRQVGGEGTPGVQDFCLGEIAMARGTGPVATRHAMADVLDLVHRLPATWAVCRSGAGRGVGGPQGRQALPRASRWTGSGSSTRPSPG